MTLSCLYTCKGYYISHSRTASATHLPGRTAGRCAQHGLQALRRAGSWELRNGMDQGLHLGIDGCES